MVVRGIWSSYFHLLYFVCLRLAHGKHECCMLPTVGLLGVLLAPSLLCFLALVFLLFTGLHDAATRAWVSVPFSFFLVFLVSDRKLCASKLMLNRHSHWGSSFIDCYSPSLFECVGNYQGYLSDMFRNKFMFL